MTEPGGGQFRASHADRERVVGILKAAFMEGRLTEDELQTRAAQALGSRTYAELAVVTADLPAGPFMPKPAAPFMPGPGAVPFAPEPAVPAGRQPNLIPFLWGVGVSTGIPVILLAMGYRLGNDYMAAWGLLLFVLEFIVFILAGVVALGTAVDSRMKNKRAAARLPPRPGPRGTPPPRLPAPPRVAG